MSEAMTSVEIEDVLSSIRRLVSEDFRPAARAVVSPVVAPVVAAPRADDKLLLTPALRVVAGSAPSAVKEGQVKPLPRLHLGIETPAPEAGQGPSAAPVAAEFESEVGDPYPSETRMEWSETGWVLSADSQALPEAAPEVAAVEMAEVDAIEAGQSTAFPEEAARFTEADEDWADRAEAEALAALDDAAAFDPEAGLRPEPPPPTETLADDLELQDGVQDVIFDEQVLRDLVRDILREELRGALGERITRNVRKLVHAEVSRLLTVQELE